MSGPVLYLQDYITVVVVVVVPRSYYLHYYSSFNTIINIFFKCIIYIIVASQYLGSTWYIPC